MMRWYVLRVTCLVHALQHATRNTQHATRNMSTFLSFHEPGFWLVVSLLCTVALLAGRPFAPAAWRTPLAVANWVGIPYLALIAGGVSPRLMGLQFLNWLTVFQLGVGLAVTVLAIALTARLVLAGEPGEESQVVDDPTCRDDPASRLPAARWQQPLASVGLSGAEEFFWCFLRGASLEILLKLGEPLTTPAYWGVWLAALLALPSVLVLQESAGARLSKAAILVVTSVLFFYTRNFWLCWAVHALTWLLLAPVMARTAPRQATG